MSVEAICRALSLAPVPADRGGQPSSACKFVLVGLANHAGRTAPARSRRWPRWSAAPGWRNRRSAPAWTGWRPRASSHRVTRTLSRPDQARRPPPQGWDLNLNLVCDDLEGAAVAVLEHQFQGLGSRLAAATQPGTDGPLLALGGFPQVIDGGDRAVLAGRPGDRLRGLLAQAAQAGGGRSASGVTR